MYLRSLIDRNLITALFFVYLLKKVNRALIALLVMTRLSFIGLLKRQVWQSFLLFFKSETTQKGFVKRYLHPKGK